MRSARRITYIIVIALVASLCAGCITKQGEITDISKSPNNTAVIKATLPSEGGRSAEYRTLTIRPTADGKCSLEATSHSGMTDGSIGLTAEATASENELDIETVDGFVERCRDREYAAFDSLWSMVVEENGRD